MSIIQSPRAPLFVAEQASPRRTDRRFVKNISPNGRYFTDQAGVPLLIHGDSPWALFQDLNAADLDFYLANRAALGTNALILSLIGSVNNGGPDNTGGTFDNVDPFNPTNDPDAFNEPYWTRMDQYISRCADYGMTLFLYAMDGWNTDQAGGVFNEFGDTTEATNYGAFIGARYKNYPNIVWMFGGDYSANTGSATPTATDDMFQACLNGIRSAGANQLMGIQMIYQRHLTSDYPYWERRADFNFVYTYYATYEAVEEGYAKSWNTSLGKPATRPSMFMEGEYDGSPQNDGGPVLTVRKQAGWSLTSGSPGCFTGQEGVWDFSSANWKTVELQSAHSKGFSHICNAMRRTRWWELVPDTTSQLVTAGRGTKQVFDGNQESTTSWCSTNSYVTAAYNPAGTSAAIYIPNAASTITVSWSVMQGSNQTATWIDPTNGAIIPATGGATSYSRSANASGAADWLLILTAG